MRVASRIHDTLTFSSLAAAWTSSRGSLSEITAAGAETPRCRIGSVARSPSSSATMRVGEEVSARRVAYALAHSLVPIALAYVGAHYLTLVLLQGQAIVPLASDPLGSGADLFGTAGSGVDYGLIGAATTWYFQGGSSWRGSRGGGPGPRPCPRALPAPRSRAALAVLDARGDDRLHEPRAVAALAGERLGAGDDARRPRADLWSALVFLVPTVVFVIWLLVQRLARSAASGLGERAGRRCPWGSLAAGALVGSAKSRRKRRVRYR